MHAIELLLDEHESFLGLFDRVRSGNDGASLFSRIKAAIEFHKHLEENFFYPKLIDEGDDELKDVVRSAMEDHRQVRTYLDELQGLTEDPERFAPRLNIVMEDIELQVEQEESNMFPLVENQFDEETLENLGTAMQAEKARISAAAENV